MSSRVYARSAASLLHHRNVTGQGQKVETNLLSTLLSSLVNQASAYLGAGVIPGILGNQHPRIAPYEVFQAADRPLVLAVGNDKQFRALVRALDCEWMADLNLYADNTSRVANRLSPPRLNGDDVQAAT